MMHKQQTAAVHKRVLVVEDDRDQLEGIMAVMKLGRGFSVVGVSSGEEALNHVNEKFDVVILDFHMGKVSGGDVLKRWLLSQPDTHFIFLTGEHDVRVVVDMMKKGASEFFTKPIDAGELLNTVTKTLGLEQ